MIAALFAASTLVCSIERPCICKNRDRVVACLPITCEDAHLFCLPVPAHGGICPGKNFRTGGWMDAVKNPTDHLIFFADDWSPAHARALGLIPLRHCPPSLR